MVQEFVEDPPAVAIEVLGLEFGLGQGAADGERLRAYKEVIVDHAVEPRGVALGNYLLMPEVGWVGRCVEADLLQEFPPEAVLQRLPRLDPTTRRCPEDRRRIRSGPGGCGRRDRVRRRERPAVNGGK
jgi:hypothetical protein